MKIFLPSVSIPPKKLVLMLLLFGLCMAAEAQPVVDYGKSYINLTKGLNGGTVEPGDTLEIRATFVVKAGTTGSYYADSCAFLDAIPAGTSYIPNSLAVLTNEGKVYKAFTDAVTDDCGWVSGTNIQINLGYNTAPRASAVRRGRIVNTDKPSFYGSSCIMVASYRVKVTAAYGTKISLGGGTITYRPYNGALKSIVFNKDSIMVYKNSGICSNTVGANTILSESGGTFGTGKAKNRTKSSKVPANYTYAIFGANMPNDYYYGVSNNTSTSGAGYTTSNTWGIPDGSTTSHRVFGVWDIIGDHTGATNPLLGNPATDTANSTGGYMVVINAAYKTDTAFLDTVSNLCPNTYYEYSAWFRNICSRCGCDSNGHGAGVSTPKYIPTDTVTHDSSGVHPNLTFSVNGYDYYTTGNILYSGQWVKKGFTYLTGPNQTSMVIHIRNNAPGGGGNDWAIDDIGVATCSPNITLTPDKPDTLCRGADDTVRFKVTSFFNNYSVWKLEKSTDLGVTWTSAGLDTLGKPASDSTPGVQNPSTGQYEYIVTRYFRLNNVDTLVKYRITLASTTNNLGNASCSFITSAPKIIRTVNCMTLLPTSIIAFVGKLKDGLANLQWTSTNEVNGVEYVIERSADQVHYIAIGSVSGHAPDGGGASYGFIDVQPVSGQAYYRIKMLSGSSYKYTGTVLISVLAIELNVRSVVNPFTDRISFDMTAPENAPAIFSVLDMYGKLVRFEKQQVIKGLNSVNIFGLSNLAAGIYTLQVQYTDKIISKRIVKLQP